jgi:hypothetical protein
MPAPRNEHTKLPKLRRIPINRKGPEGLGLQHNPQLVGGPGDAPPGFNGPSTSGHEWVWYWASRKLFDPALDPRQPPFNGGHGWDYQRPDHQFGILVAVVDFIYFLPGETVGVRIQTPFFHRGVEKDAYDAAQERSLSRFMTIRDVYSQDFIGDPSGQAAVRLLVEILGGRIRLNPMQSGTFYPVRSA